MPTEYGETVRFFRSIAPKTAIALFLRFAVSRGCRFHRRATGKTKSTGAPVTEEFEIQLELQSIGRTAPLADRYRRRVDRRFLDQSALTGEPIPVQQHVGDEVTSGSNNAGEAFDLPSRTSPPNAHVPALCAWSMENMHKRTAGFAAQSGH